MELHDGILTSVGGGKQSRLVNSNTIPAKNINYSENENGSVQPLLSVYLYRFFSRFPSSGECAENISDENENIYHSSCSGW